MKRQPAAQVTFAQQLARMLLAELSTPYDAATTAAAEAPTIRCALDAANLVKERLERLEQEELWVVLLNTRNHVIAALMVYRGNVSAVQVRLAEIFTHAVRHAASAIIVVHNHPSGDPTPSSPDIALTAKAKEAGELLGIPVLDHIIIGAGAAGYHSMQEHGTPFA